MIIAIDIETKGLDARNFILGCIIKETAPNKPEYFYNKQMMWERIISLGHQEHKRNKNLSVYAHNMAYDFYGIANLKDKNLVFNSHRPFIARYKINGKDTITFLDTFSLYKMSLKRLGELIGLDKLETPKYLLQND